MWNQCVRLTRVYRIVRQGAQNELSSEGPEAVWRFRRRHALRSGADCPRERQCSDFPASVLE